MSLLKDDKSDYDKFRRQFTILYSYTRRISFLGRIVVDFQLPTHYSNVL